MTSEQSSTTHDVDPHRGRAALPPQPARAVPRRVPGARRRRRARRLTAIAAGVLLGWPAAGLGQAPAEAEAVAEIRREIAELKREYDARLAALERRLASLEAGAVAEAPASAVEDAGDELARLRAAAREAAAATPTPQIETEVAEPAVGRERNLNRLNPEISMTGIVLGNSFGGAGGRDEFEVGEFELDLQAALDPFSRTRWTIAFGDEGPEIEEAYLVYSSLPGGLELAGGKFRQRFGPLNRQHLHALPQSDYPLVLQTFFGEEGLAQTGLSLTWLLPRPWASANEISLEITDGENEVAFAGEDFQDFSLLGRLKNYWDLSPATYLEWGLSGIAGEDADGFDSRVWGTDLTVHWRPPARAKYREVTWRSELLRSERDTPGGLELEATGWYSYVEALLRRNLYAGVRFDRVEDPLDPARRLTGWVPYVTWWQSEYVRLRLEWATVEDDLTGTSDDRFTVQATWAAGPHKHETY